MMQTGESMQRAIVTRMPCPHALWLSKCWNVF